MQPNDTSPEWHEMILRKTTAIFCDTASYWQKHRHLLWELFARDFAGKYKGTLLGGLWSIIQPLILLFTYTFVFGGVLGRHANGESGIVSFGLYIFAALIVYNAVAECLQRAPLTLTSNPNYVKKIVFPLELLGCVVAMTALAHAVVATCIWIIFYVCLIGVPPLSILYTPLVAAALFPVLLGLCWTLSAFGVILRDTAQITGFMAQALLFLTPVFYGIDTVPEPIRPYLLANPLTFLVEHFRQLMLGGQSADLGRLCLYFIKASIFSAAALLLFKRVRPTFPDLM